MYKFNVDGQIYNVSYDKVEKFLQEFPNASLLEKPRVYSRQ